MDKTNLVEIKKGQTGTGILIEHDGYISKDCGDNKQLFESIQKLNENAGDGEFYCPNPFIVSAVFQKFDVRNGNGRIYPEKILKREVERYINEKVSQKWAYGECYKPDAMILTESGWKHLFEIEEGENILTLNTETDEIEIQPVKRVVKYNHDGKMIRIKGNNINDLVTPDHGFPIYDRNNKFRKFVTATEILENDFNEYSIPCSKEINENTEWCSLSKNELSVSEEDYSGDVMCVEVENHTWYVMDNGRCHWTKNCNHPPEAVIDLSRVAINIVELHWEGKTLVGKLELITSPGFRKHGIISCQGDQCANLLLQGLKIGVSSRGLGSVYKKFGETIVGDDYEIVCWDVVSDPSTPGAWIDENPENLQMYKEEKEENKKNLIENLKKFDDWLLN